MQASSGFRPLTFEDISKGIVGFDELEMPKPPEAPKGPGKVSSFLGLKASAGPADPAVKLRYFARKADVEQARIERCGAIRAVLVAQLGGDMSLQDALDAASAAVREKAGVIAAPDSKRSVIERTTAELNEAVKASAEVAMIYDAQAREIYSTVQEWATLTGDRALPDSSARAYGYCAIRNGLAADKDKEATACRAKFHASLNKIMNDNGVGMTTPAMIDALVSKVLKESPGVASSAGGSDKKSRETVFDSTGADSNSDVDDEQADACGVKLHTASQMNDGTVNIHAAPGTVRPSN